MHEVVGALSAVARGQPIVPKLPDGRVGQPIVPTAADVVRAATEIIHQIGGRPVSQTEIVQAEAASEEMASVQAMSDAEIMRQLIDCGVLERVQPQSLPERFDKPPSSEGEDK